MVRIFSSLFLSILIGTSFVPTGAFAALPTEDDFPSVLIGQPSTAGLYSFQEPKPAKINTPRPGEWLSFGTGSTTETLFVVKDEVFVTGKGHSGFMRTSSHTTFNAFQLRTFDTEWAGQQDYRLVGYEDSDPESDSPRRALANELAVRLEDGADLDALRSLFTELQFEPLEFDNRYLKVTVPAKGLLAPLHFAEELSARPDVSWAVPQWDRDFSTRANPNDPLLPFQWPLVNMGLVKNAVAGEDLNITSIFDDYTGQGITAAVMDDGFDLNHEDLFESFLTLYARDLIDNDGDPSAENQSPHGTATASLLGARGDNGVGMTGTAPRVGIIPIRLVDLYFNDSRVAQGLGYRVNPGSGPAVDLSSNSWGPIDNGRTLSGFGPLSLAALNTGVGQGRSGRGIIYVWASGNGRCFGDRTDYDGFASHRQTIAVAASGSNGKFSGYSEPGAAVLVNAPSGYGDCSPSRNGVLAADLRGTDGVAPGDYTIQFGGTSSAAPMVAGVVALMLEANPSLTWRDIQHLLIDTATRTDEASSGWQQNGSGRYFSHDYGFGRVNAAAAVNRAKSWFPVPALLTNIVRTNEPRAIIPDGNTTGITDVVNVTSNNRYFTEHVEVTLDIEHSSRGQLQIELVSPQGTVSTFATQRNDSGDNYSNWTFTSVAHWGEDPVGDWQLRVVDAVTDEVGTLNNWTIRLYGYDLRDDENNRAILPTAPTDNETINNALTNGNFELGDEGWTFDGSALICDSFLCGTLSLEPYSGTGWMRVGSQELSGTSLHSATQRLTIPTDATTLAFVSQARGYFADGLNLFEITIDGQVIASVDGSGFAASRYELQQYDIRSYADGEEHELSFRVLNGSSLQGLEVSIDQATITVENAPTPTPIPTPTPTASPTATPTTITATPSPTPIPSPSPSPSPTPLPTITGETTLSHLFFRSEEGWVSESIAPTFDTPEFHYNPVLGSLDMKSLDNEDTIGWWGSPRYSFGLGPVVTGSHPQLPAIPTVEGVYRMTFRVSTDEVDRQLVPVMRFRASTDDYHQTTELTISSEGNAALSPTVAGATYTTYVIMPSDTPAMRIFLDLLNFGGRDAAVANFSLLDIDISYLGTPESLGSRELITTIGPDFIGTSFQPRTVSGIEAPEVFRNDGFGLIVAGLDDATSPPSDLIFGFWGSDAVVNEMIGGELYEVRWKIRSTIPEEDQLFLPAFRLRYNETALRLAGLLNVNSSAIGNALPTVDGQFYSTLVAWPLESHNQGITLSFDYIATQGSSDNTTAELILEQVEIFRVISE